MVLGIIADVLTLMMEAACLQHCPMTTWCNNPKTELTPISNGCESQELAI
jgi:hypothetical protein